MEKTKKINYPKNKKLAYNIKKKHKKRNYNEMIKQYLNLESEKNENDYALRKK